jgi:hypothetical protein
MPPAAAAARSRTGVCRSCCGRSAAASAARYKWNRQQQLHAGQVHGERLGACTGQPSAAVCHVSCRCNGLVHGFRSNASEQPSYQSMLECMASARQVHVFGRLDTLHEASRRALRTVRMPTRQTEDFRFTDLGLITSSQLQVASSGSLRSTPSCFYVLQRAVAAIAAMPIPCLLAVGRQWADLRRPVGGNCPGAGFVRRRWQHSGRQLHTLCWCQYQNHASAGLCQAL